MTPTAAFVPLSTGLSYELLSWDAEDPACDHTVLLLHGYLDSAWGWVPVMETGALRRHHVLAPSFRGHGRSDWVGAGAMYYFLDYVADLQSLVATHAKKRLSVVGHSMGGTVAAYFTGASPERVEKLALIEGLSAPESITGPARLRESMKQRAQALASRGTKAAPGGKRYATLEAAAARMRKHDAALSVAHALMFAREGCVQLPSGEWVFPHDPLLSPPTPIGFELPVAARFWGEITSELLFLEGGESPMRLGGEQRELRLGAFKNVRSRKEVLVPGAGHMMIRGAADVTAQHLAAFLDR